MADILEVTLDNFDSEVLLAKVPVVIYFYAPWCKPCREMEKIVQEVADEVGDRIRVLQVNTDREGAIVARQKIRTIPAFQVVKDGAAIDLLRGTYSKSELLEKLGGVK